MPNIRRTFIKGVMNKDVDERLLDDGYYRHAENLIINTSEGSDVGAIEKCLSNKQLSNFDFGSNVETIGNYSDESKNKLYWWVISDKGAYLIEYDFSTKILYVVLSDTRMNKVLDLKRGGTITGISKVVSEIGEKDLLLWTDNNMEICCINIERAKKYGENGFDKEDIYLIKKPPYSSPRTVLTFNGKDSNNIEDKFVAFAYRYKYLDGEYSALSPFSNYSFDPLGLKIDFDTNDNEGMINRYNAVMIYFSTGDKRVKEVQVLAKESRSNNVYIVESFDKEKESWGHDQEKNMVYSNSKLYAVLPEKELFKQFDNVPRRAKALSSISNMICIGNYVEGYDLLDKEGNKIKIDFESTVISESIDESFDIEHSINRNDIVLNNENSFKKNNIINFNISFNAIRPPEALLMFSYNGNLDLVIDRDYSGFDELLNSELFKIFMQEFNRMIVQDLKTETKEVTTIEKYPELKVANYYYTPALTISPLVFLGLFTSVELTPLLTDSTDVSMSIKGRGKSAKSNKDYELAIIYEDEFKRSSTALTSLTNTVHVPIEKSDSINKLSLEINNKAPYWAKSFRVAVKSSPLHYETILITKFYSDENYTWCKLEGNSKDKIKENDTLILKRDSEKILTYPVFIDVLEKKVHEKDFIRDNKNSNGNDIIEEAGTYIKIKPSGFSMNERDYNVYPEEASNSVKGSGNRPIVSLPIFLRDSNPVELPVGSSVYLWIASRHKPDAGWQENTFEKTYNINLKDYTLDKWFDDNILNKDLYGTIGNSTDNYKGSVTRVGSNLRIVGTKAGMSGGRYGYLDAKVIVRVNAGYYIFETTPSKASDVDIYYKTSQVFDIENGYHKGNLANQSENSPAIVELDYFNCFAFGNGLESYKIKDRFNANELSIDLGITSVSTEEYGEIIRYSDLTYSERFSESTGINELNSFNASLVNWKELDKQNGPIQKILEREGNLLVFQTEKTGQVLFGKDALYNADGTSNLAKVPYILGEYQPYAGEYGMSHPESFEKEGNRVYWVDAKRGEVLRLSLNGISSITSGLEGWFKRNLTDRFNAKIIAGIDPYNKLYTLSIGEAPDVPMIVDCDFRLNRFDISDVFKYQFKSNELKGDSVISYNITKGNATIECVYLGNNFVKSNVAGSGTIVIPMEENRKDLVYISITPVSDSISYEVNHTCPIGEKQEVISIVLGDNTIANRNINNGYSWGNSSVYSFTDLYNNTQEIRRYSEVGTKGIGKFPTEGSTVSMYALNDAFEMFTPGYNKMYYLISNEEISDALTVIDAGIELSVSKTQTGIYPNYKGDFVFEKPIGDEKLYMVWDYRFFGTITPATLVGTLLANGSLSIEVQANLPYPFAKEFEISYREIGSNEWSDVIVNSLDLGEQQINRILFINDLNVEKSYEVRSRIKSHQNQYSEYSFGTALSFIDSIPAPEELIYTIVGERARITYGIEDFYLLALKQSELYYTKKDVNDWQGPVVNDQFVNGTANQVTFIDIEKHEDYSVRVKFISNEGKESEFAELEIIGEERPEEPETPTEPENP